MSAVLSLLNRKNRDRIPNPYARTFFSPRLSALLDFPACLERSSNLVPSPLMPDVIFALAIDARLFATFAAPALIFLKALSKVDLSRLPALLAPDACLLISFRPDVSALLPALLISLPSSSTSGTLSYTWSIELLRFLTPSMDVCQSAFWLLNVNAVPFSSICAILSLISSILSDASASLLMRSSHGPPKSAPMAVISFSFCIRESSSAFACSSC